MPTLATTRAGAATSSRALESGPPGKVFTYHRIDYLALTAGPDGVDVVVVQFPKEKAT